jgi:hypothetical protein
MHLRLLGICTVVAAVLGSACSQPDPLLLEPALTTDGAGEAAMLERLRPEPYSFVYKSGLTESARVAVKDAEHWRTVWDQIWANHSEGPALPEVDFSREMLVVAALGTRPSGGYSIYVDSAYYRTDHLEVVVRSISPGAGCGATTALTQPVDIARLPRSSKPVRYRERTAVRCE